MVVTQFYIEFDRPLYHAGDTLSGHVVVVLNRPKRDQGVFVRLEGKAKVEWQRGRQRVRDKELYFDKTIALWPVSDDYELPVGAHRLPFSFPLPLNLPSTFQGEYGKVVYKAKAKMRGAWISHREDEKQFDVIASVDLNRNLAATRVGISDEAHGNICSLCCRSDPISVAVKLPRFGYVQGDTILITAQVNNQSNESLCLWTTVQQVVTYIANYVERSEKDEIAWDKKTIPPRMSRTWSEVRLQLPFSVPPTDLGGGCKLFSIKHYLKVTVEPGGLRIKFPLIIGTIPLRPGVAQLGL